MTRASTSSPAPCGSARRVPGLRREEVAHLAGVSTDYYARLEQGRHPHVSEAVLEAVARALRLDDTERGYLFELARPGTPGRHRSSPARAPPCRSRSTRCWASRNAPGRRQLRSHARSQRQSLLHSRRDQDARRRREHRRLQRRRRRRPPCIRPRDQHGTGAGGYGLDWRGLPTLPRRSAETPCSTATCPCSI
ncbi:helix-turn-helix domain-containing protein [Streptomyces sp. NPDC058247]|uniref:helix-turn-helix domain-containing protein n=1 Tax=Streptomyces sp. NPDC058247 TaxID=3346401 RepID=UPI0036ECBADC